MNTGLFVVKTNNKPYTLIVIFNLMNAFLSCSAAIRCSYFLNANIDLKYNDCTSAFGR